MNNIEIPQSISTAVESIQNQLAPFYVLHMQTQAGENPFMDYILQNPTSTVAGVVVGLAGALGVGELQRRLLPTTAQVEQRYYNETIKNDSKIGVTTTSEYAQGRNEAVRNAQESGCVLKYGAAALKFVVGAALFAVIKEVIK